MAHMSLVMAAYIAQSSSGLIRLHVQPYNKNLNIYSVTVRADEFPAAYMKHQEIGNIVRETIR